MIVKNEFKKSFTCIITSTQERKNTIKCQTDNHNHNHKHNHKHNR